jgi:surface protein
MKDNDEDFKEKIKSILQEKDIKMMMFEEFEKIICSKYNLDNNKKEDKKEDIQNNLLKVENSLKDLMNNELKEKVSGKEFNEKIKNIEEQLNKKSNDLDNIKNNLEKLNNNYVNKTNLIPQIDENIQNNKLIKKISDEINLLKIEKNNYIELKIKSGKEQKIQFINQCPTYKYFYNFERDDIEIIVDGESVSLDILERKEEFNYNKSSKECYTAQYLEYRLEKPFSFYRIFKTEGIHTIKIKFRKKLFNCSRLFLGCREIIEIDLSNLDCSQVTSCESMFDGCSSLKKLNLGTLDFSLSKNFAKMFQECRELEELDVSHFDTKNSESFERMFYDCRKLKKIDVSKFNSSKCSNIWEMFSLCERLSEINMINWDMSSLSGEEGFFRSKSPIYGLFNRCKHLKMIKMSSNFTDKSYGVNEIFIGLPKIGKFYWKKGVNCNNLLKELPVNWNREPE